MLQIDRNWSNDVESLRYVDALDANLSTERINPATTT